MDEEQALKEAQRRWGYIAKVGVHAEAGFQVSSGRLNNRWGSSKESWEAAFEDASERDRKNGCDPEVPWEAPALSAPVFRRCSA